jgi:succinate dehydrogenase / fumarate reductase, cytochrome b subunit
MSHSDSRGFTWTRLASLLSILPLGVWTANHLYDNLSAFYGAERWQEAVTEHANPGAQLMTMAVVLLPLVLHGVWGVQRLFTFRPNNDAYSYYDNFKYLLQRLSALGLLAFLGAHLWLALIHPRLVEGHAEPFAEIAREMRFHTPTLVVYLLGCLAAAYHLANGISGFVWTWGLARGRKSFKYMEWVSVGTFAVLMAMAYGAIYALWQAGAAFGP